MAPNSPQASHTTTILFFAIILISFFPGFFHYLLTLPLSLILPTSSTPANNNPLADLKMGSWSQKQFNLPSKSRGSYLVTDHVVSSLPEIKEYKVGLLNLFVQHTSCALSLNENWDDDVRADMSDALDRIAPEEGPKGEELYRHSAGEYISMAHSMRRIKSNITGCNQRVLMICPPISSPHSLGRQ